MDNASKALIMAGAILISIAIVGVGVYIFSSTGSINNQAGQQIDAAAAQTANSTLRSYAGTKIRGSTVQALIENAKVYNAQQILPVNLRLVSGEIPTDYPTEAKDQLNTYTITTADQNAFYTIKFFDFAPKGSVDGYYDTIYVNKNS